MFSPATLPGSSSFVQIGDNTYKSRQDPTYVSHKSKAVILPGREDTKAYPCFLFCSKSKYFIYFILFTVKISSPMGKPSEKEHLFPSLTMPAGACMTTKAGSAWWKEERCSEFNICKYACWLCSSSHYSFEFPDNHNLRTDSFHHFGNFKLIAAFSVLFYEGHKNPPVERLVLEIQICSWDVF